MEPSTARSDMDLDPWSCSASTRTRSINLLRPAVNQGEILSQESFTSIEITN